jgi:hypothetical protein
VCSQSKNIGKIICFVLSIIHFVFISFSSVSIIAFQSHSFVHPVAILVPFPPDSHSNGSRASVLLFAPSYSKLLYPALPSHPFCLAILLSFLSYSGSDERNFDVFPVFMRKYIVFFLGLKWTGYCLYVDVSVDLSLMKTSKIITWVILFLFWHLTFWRLLVDYRKFVRGRSRQSE